VLAAARIVVVASQDTERDAGSSEIAVLAEDAVQGGGMNAPHRVQRIAEAERDLDASGESRLAGLADGPENGLEPRVLSVRSDLCTESKRVRVDV
jgi:hypothetical protein